ncbi:hypothetical protein AB6A23_03050 [Paenibacillus tarimensis]
MSKKMKIIIFSSIGICIIIYFLSVILKDDYKEIEKAVRSINQPMTNIAHVEIMGNTRAIAFYEWSNATDEYFGITKLKKNLFGWHVDDGSTSATPENYKIGWSVSNLAGDDFDYSSLLYGKISDPGIEEVVIVTDSGNENSANIVEYGAGERFYWYLFAEEPAAFTTIGRSKEGEIIEQYP